MVVTVNGKPITVDGSITLVQLLLHLSLKDIGIAMAVNKKMIPRTAWNEFALKENDDVVIIKAACGG